MSALSLGLNPEQQTVVQDITSHLLLLAGAGTGKTSTLARRVAGLLESDTVPPEEILCLTFTNRACKEMAERIEKSVGAAARTVCVRTVHSFCAWMLRQTPERLRDVGGDFTVCDTTDALELLRGVIFSVVGRDPGERAVQILQNFIALVKDAWLEHPAGGCDGATAHCFLHRRGEIERLCVDAQYRFDPKYFHFLAKYGASIVRLYNEKLWQNNTLDFSDLLIRADALLTDPETMGLWRGRYRYVHVDEVQDVSLAEYSLLEKLCGRAVVLLCGDFNQTIYQWRGSNPDALIRRYTDAFHPRVVEFKINYRSSGQLLAVAQNLLHNAFHIGAPGGAGPSSPDCADVEIHSFDTLPEEAAWISRELYDLSLTDYSRAAVITRTNKACNELCGLLRVQAEVDGVRIPYLLADEARLFKRTEIKDALACLGLYANPRDGERLRRVLLRVLPGVGAATIGAITKQTQAGLGVALTDFTDLRTHRTGDLFEPLLAALEGGRVVVFDVESTGTDVFTDEIVQIAGIRLAPDGTVCERFERFLRPDRPVGGSERVHGFSDVFLQEHGQEPGAALMEFLDFAGDCVIVGHNVGFDMQITAQNLRRHAPERTFDSIWYDTLDLSRRFLRGLANHKLATVAAAFEAAHDPSHDAMDDILATADVLNALTEQYLRPCTDARRACYMQHLPRFKAAAELLTQMHTAAAGLDARELLDWIYEQFELPKLFAGQPERLTSLELLRDCAADCADPEKPLVRQVAELLELTAMTAGELSQRSRVGNKVAVITAHQAKGCEFDYVFLPVMQDGVFPTFQAVRSGVLTEEQRVFYVSVTRAKQKLWLSWSRHSLLNVPAKPSRFLELLG